MPLVITQGYSVGGVAVDTAGYPIDGDHLQAFCVAAGVVGSDENHLDYRRAIAAAIRQWERETGYTPFAPSAQTRTYDAPGGTRLALQGGLVSLAGIEASDGRDLVLGQTYRVTPIESAAYGAPFTTVEFAWPLRSFRFGLPTTITVMGLFGYAESVPDDAIEAILALGASKIVPQRSVQVGAATTIKQDDVELQYSAISAAAAAYTAQQNQFLDTYKSAVRRYRRQVLA